MKVLMLSWEYPPRIIGGISRVVYDLANRLGEKGIKVFVITCWEPGSREEDVNGNVHVSRVHTYDIETNSFTAWVLQLNFAMIEKGISLLNEIGGADIIHAHDWITAFTGRVLKNSFKIPLVSTIHATEYGRNKGLHNGMQRYIGSVEWWLAYESWKVICNSDYMRNEIRFIFQVPDDKLVTIPNGINMNKFSGIEKESSNRRKFALDSEKIILFVGRLVQEKGVHVLIDALPKIISRYHDVKLVIAGRGPQMDYLKGQAECLGICGKIYFTGYINDEELVRLYKCVDIAVFPSLYEPFGIVALESMLAGVPVVVTDVGGLGEIVENGVTGMKAAAGSPDSLADCILCLLSGSYPVDSITENALRKVGSMYNWDIIVGKLVNLYQEIIGKSIDAGWSG